MAFSICEGPGGSIPTIDRFSRYGSDRNSFGGFAADRDASGN